MGIFAALRIAIFRSFNKGDPMLLARFWNNRHGGIAPLMALTIVPLLGAVGAAVDYTRANAARTAFQAALDSTALMLARTAATQTSGDLQSAASDTFNALFTRPEANNVAISAGYSSSNGSTITLQGSASIKTNFLGVLGYSEIPITATAKSVWGNTRLRVALVLDNTGSMSQTGSTSQTSKMTALKTASQNLLTQLKNAAVTADDVYISIVPFNKDVNVGAGNYNESWLRWDLWEAENGTCSKSSYTTQSNCLSHSKIWTPAAHSSWNGCITDRDQNFDTTNDAPVAGGTLYPAEQYSSCPAQLMGLSNDWTALSCGLRARPRTWMVNTVCFGCRLPSCTSPNKPNT